MATLRQIASIVQNSISGGRGVTNERLPFNQIVDEVVFTYARIADEYYRQGAFTVEEYNQFFMRVDCVPVECKPAWECCDGLSSDEKVLVAAIPKTKRIRWVGTVDNKHTFPLVIGSAGRHYGHSRFMKKSYAWLVNGNRLVIMNPPTPSLKVMAIEAFFEDPRTLTFECCPGGMDTELPAPNKFIDLITGKLIESYIRQSGAVPSVNQPNTQTDQI